LRDLPGQYGLEILAAHEAGVSHANLPGTIHHEQ
jgi:hypothetical protein